MKNLLYVKYDVWCMYSAIQDNVSGYSILQVEQALRGVRSWNGWRDQMKSRHENVTRDYLDELFANWYN